MNDKKLVVIPTRKAIPNGVRFEVFKRDSFTCQYCGAKSPDVVLNVDHIHPVADGGENDILNLITSCFGCNNGKSDKKLDDQSALNKQRKQLDDLNERRNQLEMLVRWREGLADMEPLYVAEVQNTLLGISGSCANETGIVEILRWLKGYPIEEVLVALRTSFGQYLKIDDEGKYDTVSWGKAFSMVPRIARAIKSGGVSKSKLRVFYVRGILRRRLRWINESAVVGLIEDAVQAGIDIEDVVRLAKEVKNWAFFEEELLDFIIIAGDHNGKN